jgi:hypothetical protein
MRAAGENSSPEEIAMATDRMFAQLKAGLGRWIGASGYTALLNRAMALAKAEHPALSDLDCLGEDGVATAAAVRAHGAPKVAAGLAMLVAAIVDLLGRIIGEEISMRLVEQVGIPSPRGIVSNASSGRPNDK